MKKICVASGVRVGGLVVGQGLKIQGSCFEFDGFGISRQASWVCQLLWSKAWGLGFGVEGLGFRVEDLGSRV